MFRWTGATAREFLRVSYAPSEYQTKLWPLEALIERWFPPTWRGQCGFPVLSTVDHPARFHSPHAPGPRTCSHSAPRSLSQRSDSRTGVDAGCKNMGIAGRTMMVCLDILFHRRRNKGHFRVGGPRPDRYREMSDNPQSVNYAAPRPPYPGNPGATRRGPPGGHAG